MRGSRTELEREVAQLADLPREALSERWRKIYGMAPPRGIRNELMIRAAAWHLQAKRLGGLSAETRRLLRSAMNRVEAEMLARDKRLGTAAEAQVNAPSAAAADRAATVAAPPRSRRRLTPGARLIREWGGRTHVVDVIEGGYVFEAKVYPSLSAIAGQITGVHWSGPRFFGL